MNNLESVISSLVTQAHRNMVVLESDIATNPEHWRQSLWKALQEGAFLNLTVGLGMGGLLDARIELVHGTTGERMSVSSITELRGLGLKV